MKLWNEVKRHRTEVYGDEKGDEIIDSVGRLMNEFNAIDPSPQTFHYRHDKVGATNDGRIPELEIRELMAAMRSLKNFFDTQDDVVDEIEVYQQEYDRP